MSWEQIKRAWKLLKLVIVWFALLLIAIVQNFPDLFPANVVTGAILVAIGVAFALLFFIYDRLDPKTGPVQFNDFASACVRINEILNDGKKHEVFIIASSGASLLQGILRPFWQGGRGDLAIRLRIIDPNLKADGLASLKLPARWEQEADTTIRTLEGWAGRFDIKCWVYRYPPCIRGICIDKVHLFLSFYRWLGEPPEPSGLAVPQVYYQRESRFETQFRLFEEWFESAPRTQVLPPPTTGSPGSGEAPA